MARLLEAQKEEGSLSVKANLRDFRDFAEFLLERLLEVYSYELTAEESVEIAYIITDWRSKNVK